MVISTTASSENQPCSGVLHRLKPVHELLRQTSNLQESLSRSQAWRTPEKRQATATRHSIETKSLSPIVFEIFSSKYIGVTTLTFWGHVTSLVIRPFDAPCSISYRRSIVTDSLSPAVFEILGPEHIGVTTLTFQGHVTSSIT